MSVIPRGHTPESSVHQIPNNEFPLVQLNNMNITSHLVTQRKIKLLEDLSCYRWCNSGISLSSPFTATNMGEWSWKANDYLITVANCTVLLLLNFEKMEKKIHPVDVLCIKYIIPYDVM